ncbi:MAG: polyribonucleotide nucleotidyltransferase [Flavobacteriales bacterium]|nr:polyribonucleotide nucleotidyltransferase [Flavobacteriales bacterium]|tara:strand:+ start:2879 stop:5014 length:2136 start_codon:yes stop_codon:yes gene_type:complete
MIPQGLKQTINLGDGRTIEIETGRLAKQAHGSVVVRMGDTMLLATVVSNKDAKEGVNFLPLTVDYREKFAADGRYPGGFLKREARPSDQEILVMRLVDRVLRPLFPSDYHSETQLMIQLMSYDKNCMPDALAGLAASACLSLSDIPFEGPISEVRVVRIDGKFIVNPNPEQLESADMDLMVGASIDSVAMVEGEMDEISEAEMIEGIKFAHEAIKVQCAAQIALASAFKVGNKREYSHEETDDFNLLDKVRKACYDQAYSVAKSGNPDKKARKEAFGEIRNTFLESLEEEFRTEKSFLLGKYLQKVEKEAIRNVVLNEGIRLDGRSTKDIRPIWSEIDYLPSVHGSALFTRGETQSLSTVTLGTALDVNRIDNVTFQGSEKFYLHYNFPPYSTGEARPIRGVSRREIGHGNLAQRALKRMIPAETPYTIRIVSEILESNGSSSMATVCAGTLALMDAGIQMKRPVSGIAMGLISDEETGRFAVLSDILGDEDHLGDMDFKVTGTENGITACQMDIKVKGLSYDILTQALEQSKGGRMHILGEILKTIDSPRLELKPHAPRIEILKVAKDCIGGIIGPGGKIIQKLQLDTDTTITIEEVDGFGKVEILGTNKNGMDAAIAKINEIAFMPTVGEEYDGRVKNIQAYGAFVEIAAGKDGLLHISEIDWKRINNVEDVLKVDDPVRVKIIDVDVKTGKMKFSRKVLLPKPETKNE